MVGVFDPGAGLLWRKEVIAEIDALIRDEESRP
jgi:hypothetical protein